MTAVLRFEPVAVSHLDEQIVSLAWARLTRVDQGIVLECREEDRPAAHVGLQRAGARVIAGGDVVAAPPRSIPATLCDLRPLRCDGVADTIVVRPLADREATELLWRGTRKWFIRRLRDRDALRAVLRGSDRPFAWRRLVWAKPATLRSRALRTARPLIFDRDGVERGPEGFGLASHDRLTAWVTG